MIADSVNANDDVCGQSFHQDAFQECNHRVKWKAASGKWKVFFAMLLASSWVVGWAQAEEAAARAPWRVWLEPKTTHASIAGPIPGAQETELVGGRSDELGNVSWTQRQFQALKITWEEFFAQARANADTELAELKPQYVRNAQKVIEYAVLNSDRPVIASAVLGNKFLERFKDTLGEKVLVVVPSRYTAYVFPKLASNYQAYSTLIFEAYNATAFPVSTEVFEVSAQGWKAVGVYEP